MPCVDLFGAAQAVLDAGIRSGEGDDLIASTADLLVRIHDSSHHHVLMRKGSFHVVHYTLCGRGCQGVSELSKQS